VANKGKKCPALEEKIEASNEGDVTRRESLHGSVF
jgi:hypothetical protein